MLCWSEKAQLPQFRAVSQNCKCLKAMHYKKGISKGRQRNEKKTQTRKYVIYCKCCRRLTYIDNHAAKSSKWVTSRNPLWRVSLAVHSRAFFLLLVHERAVNAIQQRNLDVVFQRRMQVNHADKRTSLSSIETHRWAGSFVSIDDEQRL